MVTSLRIPAGLFLAVLAVLLAACDDGPTAGGTATGSEVTPRALPAMGTALPDDRVAEILALLLDASDDGALEAALDDIARTGDQRFVAPLIEMMWSSRMLLVRVDERHVRVLEALTGQRHGRDWESWLEWYGRTDLKPPPGFVEWKGTLLAGIDERFAGFLSADALTSIRPELIAWGGVPVDGIVPLDNPPVVLADSEGAAYLEEGEPVLGLVVNGEARAYPFRIMDPHEMANDVLGGVPISIAHCTLCGSAIAYDGRGQDGTTYTFSSSGLLYESNKLMYDRQTRSLWNQFTGRPVLGSLVAVAGASDGPLLDAFPLVTTTWSAWREQHPETTVLSLETGLASGYTLGFPYLQYYASGNPTFPLSARDLRLNAHDWVYGVLIGGVAQAYDVRLLVDQRVLNDEVAGAELVLVTTSEFIDVSSRDPLNTEVVYDLGATVLAFERPPGVTFTATEDLLLVLDQDGTAWEVTDVALIASDGRTTPRILGRQAFWFAWYAFYPHTDLVGGR